MVKYRKGIFMVAYTLEKGEPEYIIQQRKLHWKGWEFPKAGIEKGESQIETARREVKEETGLEIVRVTSHKYKGKFLYPKPLEDRPGMVGQTYFLYSVEVKKGKIKVDKSEHTSARWMNYGTAMKKLTHQNQKDCLTIVNNWLKERVGIIKGKKVEEKVKEKTEKNFRTHISKQGTIFLAGRTDDNNEKLISQVGKEEVVLHTVAPGSPFVNIKGIPKVGDLKEAAIMCARHSRDWKKNKTDIKIHQFLGKDISKSKLMKTGTFGVKNAKVIKASKKDIINFKSNPAKKGDLLNIKND